MEREGLGKSEGKVEGHELRQAAAMLGERKTGREMCVACAVQVEEPRKASRQSPWPSCAGGLRCRMMRREYIETSAPVHLWTHVRATVQNRLWTPATVRLQASLLSSLSQRRPRMLQHERSKHTDGCSRVNREVRSTHPHLHTRGLVMKKELKA